jgi:hypothetical protein
MLKTLKKNKDRYNAKAVMGDGSIEQINLIDRLGEEYGYFSKMFHPTPQSYAPNVWVIEDGASKIYRIDADKENKELIIFVNIQYMHPDEQSFIITRFFLYSTVCTFELEKMLTGINNGSSSMGN